MKKPRSSLHKQCKSCGDWFMAGHINDVGLDAIESRLLFIASLERCGECAAEIALGVMIPTTTMHGTGGGERVIKSTRPFGG